MYSTVRASSDPIQQLFIAIMEENFLKVESLLKAGVPINSKAPDGGKQALHVAVESSIKAENISKLISLGADVNAKTLSGFTPLHVAAKFGNVEAIIVLIKAGAKLESITSDARGTTPLQEAAYNGQLQAVKVLMAAGADPSYRERKHNLNAINLAIMNSYAMAMPINDIVNAILGAGLAFKKNVFEEIEKWHKSYVTKNDNEKAYLTRLKNIPVGPDSAVSADECFLRLKSALEEGYKDVKVSMQPLRSSIIKLMNQYNNDKKAERELKAIFSSTAECGAGVAPK